MRSKTAVGRSRLLVAACGMALLLSIGAGCATSSAPGPAKGVTTEVADESSGATGAKQDSAHAGSESADDATRQADTPPPNRQDSDFKSNDTPGAPEGSLVSDEENAALNEDPPIPGHGDDPNAAAQQQQAAGGSGAADPPADQVAAANAPAGGQGGPAQQSGNPVPAQASNGGSGQPQSTPAVLAKGAANSDGCNGELAPAKAVERIKGSGYNHRCPGPGLYYSTKYMFVLTRGLSRSSTPNSLMPFALLVTFPVDLGLWPITTLAGFVP